VAGGKVAAGWGCGRDSGWLGFGVEGWEIQLLEKNGRAVGGTDGGKVASGGGGGGGGGT
jgi:hypothetical protein